MLHCKKNEYFAVINHDAIPILLFDKLENTSENPTALEARESPMACGNSETLLVIQHVLLLIC